MARLRTGFDPTRNLAINSLEGIVTQHRACGPTGRPIAKRMQKISYAGYRFPPEIIQQAMWLYLRFTLSLRDVEDLLAERGGCVPPGPFGPAQAVRQTMRDWQLDCRIDKRIDDLAKMFNPIIRGWINYYGCYHKSALSRAL